MFVVSLISRSFLVDLDLQLVESREEASAGLLSTTNVAHQRENRIKLVTDGDKQVRQSNTSEKADATGESVREDAIDVDDTDGKLSKSAHVSDNASQTIVCNLYIFSLSFYDLLLC